MEFRVFMQAVEREIDNFQSQAEIKEWLKNYARTIREEDRKEFLKQFGNKKRKSHKAELKSVIEWCEMVEEQELTLSCCGYEGYGDSYWDNDWTYEYADYCGIGDRIKRFYELAEQCVYDKDYKTASTIYLRLGDLIVTAEDEDGGDPIELTVEELVKEDLVSLNLKRIALLTLYSTYQITKINERSSKFYTLFSKGMFKDIKLEDIMTVGTEPLEDLDSFMELWIAYLRGQNDNFTSRLLTEAVVYRYGDEGLLEEAKRSANQHPRLYIEQLEKYYNSHMWEKLYREGKEALSLMKRNMEIRGYAARLTAAGARALGRTEEVKYACIEALYSEQSAGNFLRMITCESITEAEKSEALNYLEEVRRGDTYIPCDSYSYSWLKLRDTDSYRFNGMEYITIQFFAQRFDIVLKECKMQKDALGWTGEYIRTGVPLLLFVLYKGDVYPSAMQMIMRRIQSDINYKNEYNEPHFEDAASVWAGQLVLDEGMEKEILGYLQQTIDARVKAIVSGKHRGSYDGAAVLAAALGEVEESIGIANGKESRIQMYLNQFPKHRAFKDEMKKYR